jgi:hypothetical protein
MVRYERILYRKVLFSSTTERKLTILEPANAKYSENAISIAHSCRLHCHTDK